MKLAEARELIRSPSAAVAVGLVSALLLGSLATAGMNTLWVSRVMIGASALIIVIYVILTSFTSDWRRRNKIIAILAVIALHALFERVETWSQQTATAKSIRSMPVPPLLLMLPPGKLGYSNPATEIPGMALAVSYLDRPIGGYAGFGRIGDNDNDDVMLAIDHVELRNLSSNPLRLSWILVVDGEGKHFELDGSGRGKWERQLNTNDYFATTKKPRLSWLLSPLELESNGKTSIATSIGFVAPRADADVREVILRGNLPSEYTAMLVIKDEGTGIVSRLRLPFGIPPTPAVDPVSRMLRERTER